MIVRGRGWQGSLRTLEAVWPTTPIDNVRLTRILSQLSILDHGIGEAFLDQAMTMGLELYSAKSILLENHILCGRISIAKTQILDSRYMPSMGDVNVFVHTALNNEYYDDARDVLTLSHNFVKSFEFQMYDLVITAFAGIGKEQETLELLRQMEARGHAPQYYLVARAGLRLGVKILDKLKQSGPPPNETLYISLLRQCGTDNEEFLGVLFRDMIGAGISPGPGALLQLLDFALIQNNQNWGHDVFSAVNDNPELATGNTLRKLLKLFIQNKNFEKSLEIYHSLKDKVPLTPGMFAYFIFQLYDNGYYAQGLSIYKDMLSRGLHFDLDSRSKMLKAVLCASNVSTAAIEITLLQYPKESRRSACNLMLESIGSVPDVFNVLKVVEIAETCISEFIPLAQSMELLINKLLDLNRIETAYCVYTYYVFELNQAMGFPILLNLLNHLPDTVALALFKKNRGLNCNVAMYHSALRPYSLSSKDTARGILDMLVDDLDLFPLHCDYSVRPLFEIASWFPHKRLNDAIIKLILGRKISGTIAGELAIECIPSNMCFASEVFLTSFRCNEVPTPDHVGRFYRVSIASNQKDKAFDTLARIGDQQSELNVAPLKYATSSKIKFLLKKNTDLSSRVQTTELSSLEKLLQERNFSK